MIEIDKMKMYETVMVIDDNEVDRYIAERNIKKYLFSREVIVADSGASALEILASFASTPEKLPQLIFLDIRMPEMDGFDFLKKYEELPEPVRKNCIIMMLSTSLNPNDHEQANSNKYVSKFLNKPLDKEKLSGLQAAA